MAVSAMFPQLQGMADAIGPLMAAGHVGRVGLGSVSFSPLPVGTGPRRAGRAGKTDGLATSVDPKAFPGISRLAPTGDHVARATIATHEDRVIFPFVREDVLVSSVQLPGNRVDRHYRFSSSGRKTTPTSCGQPHGALPERPGP